MIKLKDILNEATQTPSQKKAEELITRATEIRKDRSELERELKILEKSYESLKHKVLQEAYDNIMDIIRKGMGKKVSKVSLTKGVISVFFTKDNYVEADRDGATDVIRNLVHSKLGEKTVIKSAGSGPNSHIVTNDYRYIKTMKMVLTQAYINKNSTLPKW